MLAATPARRNGKPPHVPDYWIGEVERKLQGLQEGESAYITLADSPYGMPDIRVVVTKGTLKPDAEGTFEAPEGPKIAPHLRFAPRCTSDTVEHELMHLIQWMLGSRELPEEATPEEHFQARNRAWRGKGTRRGTAPGSTRGTTYFTRDVEFYPWLRHHQKLESGFLPKRTSSEFLRELRELEPGRYKEALRYLAEPPSARDYVDTDPGWSKRSVDLLKRGWATKEELKRELKETNRTLGRERKEYFEQEAMIAKGQRADIYTLWEEAMRGDPDDDRLGRRIAGVRGAFYTPVLARMAHDVKVPALERGSGEVVPLYSIRSSRGRWAVVDTEGVPFERAWKLASGFNRALRSPSGHLYLPGGSLEAPQVLDLATGAPAAEKEATPGAWGWSTTRRP
jgi:hypothetical protein